MVAASPTATTPETESVAALTAEVRGEVVWLGAEIAVLSALGQTRPLAPAETAQLAHLVAKRDQLLARLTELRAAPPSTGLN